MKYHIRTGNGEELTVADGRHIVMLFRQRFLEPDDQIRKEGSEKWRRLGDIPEYANMLAAEKSDASRFKMIFFITALLGCLGIVGAAFF